MNQIILGDCLDVLKTLPDCSVDSVVTDPPYGLGTKEPSGDEIIAYLQGAELDTGGDFMGRDWDIPSVAVWRECFRVLKPGGHLLSFGGTRTFDLISIGIRAAGFECRDTIAQQFGVMCLQWIQGQGFPKSINVRKALEKMGLSYEEAEQWEGWNCALKPSWEPILVFRKPIEESTVAKQVLKTGTGAMNIDACRVGTQAARPGSTPPTSMASYGGFEARSEFAPSTGGRWPANILLTHSEHCQKVGFKKVPAPVINRFTDGMKPFGDGAGYKFESEQTGDAEGNETVPVYECEDGCPVKVLDLQSGARNGRSSNSGGASRFYSQFEPDAPFIYSAKVSKAERDRGLPKGTNKHPTLKPQQLMRWLVRLVTHKGGTVLDPYFGSGSTGVAAQAEGCSFIGIERDPEFHAVAVQRCATAAPQPDAFDLMGDADG